MREVTGGMQTKWAGQPVCFYDSIESTNTEAKRLAEEGASHGTVVLARMQTAGRGRRGRNWISPPDSNIYFTLLLRPTFEPDKASMLTLVMAHSVAKAIRQETGLEAGIKWPNDIVIDGRKICGILTEMNTERDAIRNVVIGVGVNVHEQQFPPELADKATFVDAEYGGRVSRERLLEAILKAFEEDYELFVAHGSLTALKDSYNALLVNRDREVCVLDPAGEYRGIARGITDTGVLIVEPPDGTCREVFAGEVSVRGIYGYV